MTFVSNWEKDWSHLSVRIKLVFQRKHQINGHTYCSEASVSSCTKSGHTFHLTPCAQKSRKLCLFNKPYAQLWIPPGRRDEEHRPNRCPGGYGKKIHPHADLHLHLHCLRFMLVKFISTTQTAVRWKINKSTRRCWGCQGKSIRN